MGMFTGIDASASGLTAERLRMDVIANNLANANTTRTAEGTPYKRRYVVFEPRKTDKKDFQTMFQNIYGKTNKNTGTGVRAIAILEDKTEGPLVYDPGHPDADAEGYVMRPNVNAVQEMVDMITASRSYEANVSALNTSKNMAVRVLDIGK